MRSQGFWLLCVEPSPPSSKPCTPLRLLCRLESLMDQHDSPASSQQRAALLQRLPLHAALLSPGTAGAPAADPFADGAPPLNPQLFSGAGGFSAMHAAALANAPGAIAKLAAAGCPADSRLIEDLHSDEELQLLLSAVPPGPARCGSWHWPTIVVLECQTCLLGFSPSVRRPPDPRPCHQATCFRFPIVWPAGGLHTQRCAAAPRPWRWLCWHPTPRQRLHCWLRDPTRGSACGPTPGAGSLRFPCSCTAFTTQKQSSAETLSSAQMRRGAWQCWRRCFRWVVGAAFPEGGAPRQRGKG